MVGTQLTGHGIKMLCCCFMILVGKKSPSGCDPYNGGFSPHFTPQVMIIFSRKKPMGSLGKPTILGNPHMTVQTGKGTSFPRPLPWEEGY